VKINGRALELLMMMAVRPQQEYSGSELSKSLGISSGTLYPLLLKAENAGFLNAHWEDGDPVELGRPRRRYYRINGAGIDAVDARMRRLNVKLRPRGGVADGGVTA
jgi:DNA-binding PadR family transcriptional regulator